MHIGLVCNPKSAYKVKSFQILDTLVVNCGYPVQLAISKRDFLNKLVFRFPPGPNYQMDQTHEYILRLIGKWSEALCKRSKHRGDFGNIRLMYSLLKSKGFHFPPLQESEINAIIHNEQDVLWTAFQPSYLKFC